MKYLACLVTLCFLVLLCPTSAGAQIGRRGRTSERIGVPVEVPPPPPEFDPDGMIEAGAIVSCDRPGRSASEADAPAETVYRGKEVDTKALIAETPDPAYTEAARLYGTSGRVALRATLAAEGKVSEVKVLRALPDGLTESAIDAACRIRFTPAVRGGQTVSQYVTVEYDFEADEVRLPPPGSRRPVGVPPPGVRARRFPPTFPYTRHAFPLSRPWSWSWGGPLFPLQYGCVMQLF
jgi:TonB family protein